MTCSPLSPFMHLFRISVSLRLVCPPGFVLLLSVITTLSLVLPLDSFSPLFSSLGPGVPADPQPHFCLCVMDVWGEDQP